MYRLTYLILVLFCAFGLISAGWTSICRGTRKFTAILRLFEFQPTRYGLQILSFLTCMYLTSSLCRRSNVSIVLFFTIWALHESFKLWENVSRNRIQVLQWSKQDRLTMYTRCNWWIDKRDKTLKISNKAINDKLECGPMPNVMAALPNIGDALCSTPQSLADAHY